MLSWPEQERRRFERVICGANAALYTRGHTIGHFDLCNLSAGGALVQGRSDIRRGHLVHLVLSFSELQEPIGISALIHDVRQQYNQFAQLALRFPSMNADLEDHIQDAVLHSLVKSQATAQAKADYKTPLRRN